LTGIDNRPRELSLELLSELSAITGNVYFITSSASLSSMIFPLTDMYDPAEHNTQRTDKWVLVLQF
jgi:hypothetical protein